MSASTIHAQQRAVSISGPNHSDPNPHNTSYPSVPLGAAQHQVPMIPQPADFNTVPKLAPPVQQRPLASGSYNDAPMVAPRVPSAPIQSQVPPAAFIPSPSVPAGPSVSAGPSKSSPLLPAQVGGNPLLAPLANQQQQQSQSQSQPPKPAAPSANLGPVDPAQIPPNFMNIYKTINMLIARCQEEAMVSFSPLHIQCTNPFNFQTMQRRVVEDSARRMQTLFWQLVKQELSMPVLGLLNDMCSRKFISLLYLFVVPHD
jgi:hypothetical protein